MGLSRKRAFAAIAHRIREKYGFSYDETMLLKESRIKEYQESEIPSYKLFAKAYEAKEFEYGGHPDYNYLADTENIGKTESGTITTFFLDLRNFTKYCYFLDGSDVYKAKAAVIETVINICLMYEGHIHEIPGDGVMVFWGGKQADDIDMSQRAINAASDAMKTLEEEIIPAYNKDPKYPNIHPKMGIDYGDVVWGAYGAEPNYEVKATSFYADIASKMMSQCKAREIAIGNSLKVHLVLGVDDDYLEKKEPYKRQLTINGEEQSISYEIWSFNWNKYLSERQDQDKDLSELWIVSPSSLYSVGSIERMGSRTKLGQAKFA